jgi:hypothetical protein
MQGREETRVTGLTDDALRRDADEGGGSTAAPVLEGEVAHSRTVGGGDALFVVCLVDKRTPIQINQILRIQKKRGGFFFFFFK